MLTQTDYAIVLYGRSQAGKSSTIRCLIEKSRGDTSHLPTVGTGDGKSCTKTAQIYQTPLGLTLDLPGPDDAELQLDTDAVAKLGAFELLKQENTDLKQTSNSQRVRYEKTIEALQDPSKTSQNWGVLCAMHLSSIHPSSRLAGVLLAPATHWPL